MMLAIRLCAAVALMTTVAASGIGKEAEGRVVEGAATSDQLWVLNSSGALISYNLKTGRKKVVAAQGAADLTSEGGRILALYRRNGGYEIIDLRSGRSAAPLLNTDDELLSIIAGPQLFALGRATVFRFEDGKWKPQKLREKLDWGLQISPVATQAGRIYVGFNRGEWGGGLYTIDPKTGHVEEVRRVDDHPCGGPLAHECDPVTGLIRDPTDPGCVIASVGLSHFMSHGRIMRVCGMKAEVLFSRPVPLQPDEMDMGSTWPFFGLLASNNGWVAVSYGRLFRSSDGLITDSPLPELAEWHGLHAAFVGDDFIALSTDINWTKSLSGRTPLLVSIQR